MIITKDPNGDVNVEFHARLPLVYLDNWAISNSLSRDETRRWRFLDIFRMKGTLLFSWANVIELSNQTLPIKALLDGIGEHWWPIEWNPFAAIRKEHTYAAGETSPAISETFVTAYYPHIHGGALTLTSVLDLLRHDNTANAKVRKAELTDAVQKFVNETKAKLRRNRNWLDQQYPSLPFDPQKPAFFVFTELLRMLASEKNFTFTPNDGLDLFHATVPAAYGDFVLLDTTWTRRVRNLHMPGRTVYAFAEPELDQFLDAFESCVIVPSI